MSLARVSRANARAFGAPGPYGDLRVMLVAGCSAADRFAGRGGRAWIVPKRIERFGTFLDAAARCRVRRTYVHRAGAGGERGGRAASDLWPEH
jgi:hypothetical protein